MSRSHINQPIPKELVSTFPILNRSNSSNKRSLIGSKNIKYSTKPVDRHHKQANLQIQPKLIINQPNDQFEQEADNMAEFVIGNAPLTQQLFSASHSRKIGIQLQEVNGEPESEKEKYEEALKKTGEAFLETPTGKQIKEKAGELGDPFISSLPGKVASASTLSFFIAALAKMNAKLPFQPPAIPLDVISPGLKLKIKYEGPIPKPKKVMFTLSGSFGAKSPIYNKSNQKREENLRLRRDLQEFQNSLKTAEEKKRDEELRTRFLLKGINDPRSPLFIPGFNNSKEDDFPEEERDEETKKLHRKEINENSRNNLAPKVINDVLNAPGQPLPITTRKFMESRFGYDFSEVRIHNNYQAGQSAKAINAAAYATGHDIVFGSGQYSPETTEGKRLLAHELTHVVQQNSRKTPKLIQLKEKEDEYKSLQNSQTQKKPKKFRENDTSLLQRKPDLIDSRETRRFDLSFSTINGQDVFYEIENGKQSKGLSFPNSKNRNYYQEGDIILLTKLEQRQLQRLFPELQAEQKNKYSFFSLLKDVLLGSSQRSFTVGHKIKQINSSRNTVTTAGVIIFSPDDIVELDKLVVRRDTDLVTSFIFAKTANQLLTLVPILEAVAELAETAVAPGKKVAKKFVKRQSRKLLVGVAGKLARKSLRRLLFRVLKTLKGNTVSFIKNFAVSIYKDLQNLSQENQIRKGAGEPIKPPNVPSLLINAGGTALEVWIDDVLGKKVSAYLKDTVDKVTEVGPIIGKTLKQRLRNYMIKKFTRIYTVDKLKFLVSVVTELMSKQAEGKEFSADDLEKKLSQEITKVFQKEFKNFTSGFVEQIDSN